MERFVVIGMTYNEKRYIKAHPILKKLPLQWSEKIMLKTGGPRITGTIFDKQEKNELGYIIDVPGFFAKWDMLTEEKRLKYIQRLLNIMETKGIRIMVFPLINQVFSRQECEYCVNKGFVLLDSFHIRLASQIESIERMLAILGKELHTMEVMIWRADTDVGEIWSEFLAPHFNYMVLGGYERHRLDRLSERIINATGLACSIKDRIEDIPKECDIIIWTEKIDDILYSESSKLVITSGIISEERLSQVNKKDGIILLESGWIKLPYDIFCDVELYPLEEIGVLEGLFYMISEYYRIVVSQYGLDLNQVMNLRNLFKLYPLYCEGFISYNQFVSYNGFRKMYFKKVKEKLYSDIP